MLVASSCSWALVLGLLLALPSDLRGVDLGSGLLRTFPQVALASTWAAALLFGPPEVWLAWLFAAPLPLALHGVVVDPYTWVLGEEPGLVALQGLKLLVVRLLVGPQGLELDDRLIARGAPAVGPLAASAAECPWPPTTEQEASTRPQLHTLGQDECQRRKHTHMHIHTHTFPLYTFDPFH